MTDPIYSDRCSPFSFAGPKRLRPPGVHFEDLPDIKIVLISHNHYDHLDKETIKRLNKSYDLQFVVPLGLSQLLRKWGCQNVQEVDWWDEIEINNLKIRAIPANHFSSRGLLDRDKTLWCGYQIQNVSFNIYFVGDTGYSDIFDVIAEKLNEPDISLIPIGAYKPEWFMSPIHISPAQAVKIHQTIKSKKSIAMHFGTFPLADDNSKRSTQELIQVRDIKGIKEEDFIIPQEGLLMTFNK